MDEILNWPHLGTAAGVSSTVVLLTQILKHYLPEKLDPKWTALALSLILTYSTQIISGDYAVGTFILSFFNAIISAGTAIGAYEAFVKPVARHVQNRHDGEN